MLLHYFKDSSSNFEEDFLQIMDSAKVFTTMTFSYLEDPMALKQTFIPSSQRIHS